MRSHYEQFEEAQAVCAVVEGYINEVKNRDEFVRMDPLRLYETCQAVWYSHICQGGGFNFAFYIGVDKTKVRLSPATDYEKPDKRRALFDISDPDGRDIKTFIRECFDIVKKHQNRKPWPW